MANDEQLDPVEQIFLYAYPNPNRIGCPGDAVVRAIAQKKLPLDHPAREHLAKCSPCFADFKRFRGEYQRRAKVIWVVEGIAALLVVGILSWLWLLRDVQHTGFDSKSSAGNPSHPVPQQTRTADDVPARAPVPDSGTTVAVLNLEGLSRTRGVEEPVKPDLQRLPRKSRIAISIYLPLGSEDGHYEIRLLRSAPQLDQPVRTYEGSATVQNGLTMLPIVADFSTLEPGTYVLAFRRGNESWRFGKVGLD